MTKKLYILLIALLFSELSFAQVFEIRTVVVDASTVGIEMRETSGSDTPTTGSFVTDLVFGLKWSNGADNDLGSVDNTPDYNINKSDGEKINGSDEFQAFGASSTPFNFPANWTEDVWVEICQVASSSGNFTGTIEICEPGFDASTGPNIGLNLTDYTPTINGSANFTVLPAVLGKFEVLKRNDHAYLTWGTSSEINVSHFDIEKSADGSSWEYVNEVRANGNSNENIGYEYLDYTTNTYVSEGVVYYRLKMVDIDGTFEYSDVKSLDFGDIIINSLTVSPNPTTHTASIFLSNDHTFNSLKVMDVSGRLLFKYDISKINRLDLDIEKQGMNTGLYFIIATSESGSIATEKLFVR